MMNKNDAIERFGLSHDRRVITITGGSQGSRTINRAVSAAVGYLTDRLNIQLIWQTGTSHYDDLRHFESTYPSVKIFPFLEPIGPAYSAADLIVSRAGALTLAEIAWCNKPSLLIPFPGASADHQTKNADTLRKVGAAVVLPERELSRERFVEEIENLISNPQKLSQMGDSAGSLSRPGAAEKIVDQILALAEA